MKRTTTYNRRLSLVFAAVAGVQAGSAWAASSHKATSHTYKGPNEYTRYGPVQVSIIVKNKRIAGVKATIAPDQGRSVFIENQAIPILKQETLRTQSAQIDEVSGATDTSEAYIKSLQAAIKKAHL